MAQWRLHEIHVVFVEWQQQPSFEVKNRNIFLWFFFLLSIFSSLFGKSSLFLARCCSFSERDLSFLLCAPMKMTTVVGRRASERDEQEKERQKLSIARCAPDFFNWLTFTTRCLPVHWKLNVYAKSTSASPQPHSHVMLLLGEHPTHKQQREEWKTTVETDTREILSPLLCLLARGSIRCFFCVPARMGLESDIYIVQAVED